MVKNRINITITIKQEVVYFEWCHFECCTSIPWPTFYGHWNANTWKTVRPSKKCFPFLYTLKFAIEWECCKCSPWTWPKFSRSNIAFLKYIWNGESWHTSTCCDFWRGWHSPPNGFTVHVVLRDGLNFQGQTFETLIFLKWWELAKECGLQLL